MTTGTRVATKATKDKEKTRAGNYFVSNYPPFFFWKPENIDDAHQAINQPANPETPLGLYLHIPFCRKRCHFCYFKVYTDKNSSEIKRYLDGMRSEFSLYLGRPFLSDRKPKFIYFGGGTPSYLSPHQLTGLVKELQSGLPWEEAEEVTFECEPGTLTESKLEAIREIGVTRLSLGIENFDDDILEMNGRAHRSPEIHTAYQYARSLDFPQINIDLIAGMLGETDENWKRCVEKTIDLEPDSITIYQMEIPFNTTIYQRMKEEGSNVAPVADWDRKREWVREAFEALEARGYAITSAYTAVRDPDRTRFVYRDSLWSGADLLSLGVSSFSHIGGTHFQNEKDYGPYLEKAEKGELPVHRALKMTEEEQLVREVILQFKRGWLDRGYFREKFNVDIYDRFSDQLVPLQQEGRLRFDDDMAALDREGLLRVDSYLHDFFLPEHRDGRYT